MKKNVIVVVELKDMLLVIEKTFLIYLYYDVNEFLLSNVFRNYRIEI